MDITFQQLLTSLREAVTNGELESIQMVDHEIKAHIEEFSQQGDVSIVKRELEQLLDEYLEFIEKVEDIQKSIGAQLRNVQRGNLGSSKYQLMMNQTTA